MIVGGVDIGLLVLASLQPGPGPAQDHLAAGETHKRRHNIICMSTHFFTPTCKFELFFVRVFCTCRQSARRCSSLWGRASRGDSAPSDSSRICGPWHSTWRHVSLCTLRLLGFPSLLNRKDLHDAGSKEGIKYNKSKKE